MRYQVEVINLRGGIGIFQINKMVDRTMLKQLAKLNGVKGVLYTTLYYRLLKVLVMYA